MKEKEFYPKQDGETTWTRRKYKWQSLHLHFIHWESNLFWQKKHIYNRQEDNHKEAQGTAYQIGPKEGFYQMQMNKEQYMWLKISVMLLIWEGVRQGSDLWKVLKL